MGVDWNAVTAAGTAVAAIAAAAAAAISLKTGHDAARSANQARLKEQLQSYLDNYLLLVRDEFDPLSIDGFKKLSRRDKRHIEILAGLLVGTLDTMFELKDRRSKIWAGFLIHFPSVLLSDHFRLEDYATHPSTLKAIAAARTEASKKAAETKTEAPLPK